MTRSAALLAASLAVAGGGPSLAADSVEIDCKAQLAPWVGRTAADLEKSWGKPTTTAKWRRGGSKIVYDLTAASPETTEERKVRLPPAPDRGVPGGPGDGTITYEKSVSYDDDGKRTVKESPRGTTWVPHRYLFFADAAGAIKKVDCAYGPPAAP